MEAKEQGRKQKSKPFNDSEDVYNCEYRLQNAISLAKVREDIIEGRGAHLALLGSHILVYYFEQFLRNSGYHKIPVQSKFLDDFSCF